MAQILLTPAFIRVFIRLCEEFGFSEFAEKLSEFRPSMAFQEAEDADTAGRMTAFEEKAEQHDGAISVLQSELRQLSTDFGRLAEEVSALQSASTGMQSLSGEVSTLKAQITAGLGNPVSQQLSTELSELRREVSIMKAQVDGLLPTATPSVPNPPPPSPAAIRPSPSKSPKAPSMKAQIDALPPTATPSVPNLPPLSPAPIRPSPQQPPVLSGQSLDSQIISDFPEIFAEFREKHFEILWRGSCDGFKAKEFHRRCDGHANTLTVILDTEGNIFGGFTPVKWDSQVWSRRYGREFSCLKIDYSLRSFLFTLKNPHNIAARIFELRARKKPCAIHCSPKCGLDFRGITVSGNCNATASSTFLGGYYTNGTGLDGQIVLTGSRYFRVREIEVFEIAD
jgi:hypothetical protein